MRAELALKTEPRASGVARASQAASQGRARAPRLTSTRRRRQLLSVASEAIVADGLVGLSMERLARRAGVSKGLLYHYFTSQNDLLANLIEGELEALALDTPLAALSHDFVSSCATLGSAYLDRVAEHGPILPLLAVDRSTDAALDGGLRHRLAGLRRRLAAPLRRHTGLSHREALIAVGMIMAVPEQAGRMVAEGRLERGLAHRVCALHITALLDSLRNDDKPPRA